jgi:voltage-gated sodium channel
MQHTLRQIADAPWFQHTITAVILLAGVLVGLETYPSISETWGGLLHRVDQLILAVFVAEVIVKIGAEGNKPWRYFTDPWNVFDFAIVAVCFMPFDAQGVAVLRLARLLRVLKLVRALPKLQILVSALLKSIPSMGYVSLLLFMLFYLYAVAATMFFGANDPVHFGRLDISMLSLFRAVTLEDWTDLMYIQMYGCADYGYDGMMAQCTQSQAMPLTSVAFFVSFVLLGTMVILNLFVGVIMSGMDEAQAEQRELALLEAAGEAPTLDGELSELQAQLAALQDHLTRVQRLAARTEQPTGSPSPSMAAK